MADIIVYTKDYCGFCARAKSLLSSKEVVFDEIDVTHDTALEAEMITRSKRHTVPQIFIDGDHIGGSDDLADLDTSGELDRLLTSRVGERAA